MAGDELEDGLAYDVDFSADEAPDSKDNLVLESEDELINESDVEKEDKPVMAQKSEQKTGKKRKAGDSKLKEKKKIKMEMDLEQKKSISTESSTEVIADYINKIVAQKNRKLTSLELADLYISKNDIRSTSELEGPRNLEGLAKFIDSRFSNMLPISKKNKKQKKSKVVDENNDEKKYIAIISMSALRACDVFRATKDLGGSSLKLINKNKLDVDISILQKSSSRVLCCTAGRLRKVYQSDSNVLKKEEIKIIILDNSFLDQKGQNIWDIPETIHVLRELTSSGAKIYLY